MFQGRYELHGSDRSFFTRKVEGLLRFMDLPYATFPLQPTPPGGEPPEIARRARARVIPVLRTPEDWVLWDSTPIAAFLDARFPARSVIPKTPVQYAACRLLEDWIDEWFTRPAMYTRWNFQESVDAVFQGEIAKQAFGKTLDALDDEERARAAKLAEGMRPFQEYMGTRVASRIATTLETGQDVPVWFEAFLTDLSKHLEQLPYLLGDRPSVADFAFVGGAMAHFVYDPWPRRLLERVAPAVIGYVERCWDAKPGRAGWLADDALAPTLAPFWDEMQARFLPYLEANRAALARGESAFELDLGFGPRRLHAIAYREQSRLDVRDDLLRLDADALARVRRAIPAGVLESYLREPEGELGPVHGGLFPGPTPAA